MPSKNPDLYAELQLLAKGKPTNTPQSAIAEWVLKELQPNRPPVMKA